MNKATVYRSIRDGKLAASKLGRTYWIPVRSLELLLRATRTRPYLTLRDYSSEQIAEFVRADQLDPATQNIAGRFAKATERKGTIIEHPSLRLRHPHERDYLAPVFFDASVLLPQPGPLKVGPAFFWPRAAGGFFTAAVSEPADYPRMRE